MVWAYVFRTLKTIPSACLWASHGFAPHVVVSFETKRSRSECCIVPRKDTLSPAENRLFELGFDSLTERPKLPVKSPNSSPKRRAVAMRGNLNEQNVFMILTSQTSDPSRSVRERTTWVV